jgi:hypothetical protein
LDWIASALTRKSHLDRVGRILICPVYQDEVADEQIHVFNWCGNYPVPDILFLRFCNCQSKSLIWLILPFFVVFYVIRGSPDKHQTSFLAAFMAVVRAIAPQDTYSEGAVVPVCPVIGCDTVLSRNEILRIIDRGYHEKLHESGDFTLPLSGKTMEQLMDAAKALILKRATHGLIRCPTCVGIDGVDYSFDADVGVDRIVCPNSCGTEFCRNCNLSPYHHHCSCAEVVQYTRAWNDWCDSGRNPYVAEMIAHDETYASLMADYEKAEQGRVSDVLFNV